MVDRQSTGTSGNEGTVRSLYPVHVLSMDPADFEQLVAEALDGVPDELLGLLQNVVVLTDDEPPPDEPHDDEHH